MENNTNELSRRSRKENKKTKKKKRGCLWFFLILLLLIGGVFAYGYMELRDTTSTIHTGLDDDFIPHASREDKKADLSGEEPFSILLMGVDAREGDRGRSDTLMVMTVNPNTNKTTLVSIPRDTYATIVGRGTQDKINHAYAFGGPSMSMNTVQNFLDIPIDYYVSVNMEGIQQIVDAVDGVSITPSTSFNQSGYTFTEGQPTHMNGQMALAYSRMRSQDGDYARQGRQREVVLAIVNKITSLNSILNYQSILQTTENNVQTNMEFSEMTDVFMNYRGAIGNLEQVQMSGAGTMMGGIYYIVIPDEEINSVSQMLQTELEINE